MILIADSFGDFSSGFETRLGQMEAEEKKEKII